MPESALLLKLVVPVVAAAVAVIVSSVGNLGILLGSVPMTVVVREALGNLIRVGSQAFVQAGAITKQVAILVKVG